MYRYLYLPCRKAYLIIMISPHCSLLPNYLLVAFSEFTVSFKLGQGGITLFHSQGAHGWPFFYSNGTFYCPSITALALYKKAPLFGYLLI